MEPVNHEHDLHSLSKQREEAVNGISKLILDKKALTEKQKKLVKAVKVRNFFLAAQFLLLLFVSVKCLKCDTQNGSTRTSQQAVEGKNYSTGSSDTSKSGSAESNYVRQTGTVPPPPPPIVSPKIVNVNIDYSSIPSLEVRLDNYRNDKYYSNILNRIAKQTNCKPLYEPEKKPKRENLIISVEITVSSETEISVKVNNKESKIDSFDRIDTEIEKQIEDIFSEFCGKLK